MSAAGSGERGSREARGSVQTERPRRRSRRSSVSGDYPRRASYSDRSSRTPLGDELRLLGWTVAPAVVAHPLNYAQVLMQVGYEPFPPRIGEDFLGRPVANLASVFDYLVHIREHDGYKGLFRGIGPSVTHIVVGMYVARLAEKIVNFLWYEVLFVRRSSRNRGRFPFSISKLETMGSLVENVIRFEPTEKITTSSSYGLKAFVEDVIKESAIVSISTAVAWPFHVIALRTMAQFVGGEKIYNDIASSIREILINEGFTGFFAGLLPGWLNAVSITVLSNLLVYSYTATNLKSLTGINLVRLTAAAGISELFYPLRLVSRLSAISGARLAAAKPPFIPKVSYSYQLYEHMNRHGQARRGSNLFYRQMAMPESFAMSFDVRKPKDSDAALASDKISKRFFFPFRFLQ
ncbi:mitochondrial carrier homolog 2-like [Paramacrobiotus metropolitanus]|uniref:mitochondrial carrier homolog 2-like n=1 Tax=Paramacrobiotus metropolitanus TaxID=2943436 RepID=UPI0024456B37|nr:mitochondrial carrier homolog 2-like [Paramacrobiotus metropolitanus]